MSQENEKGAPKTLGREPPKPLPKRFYSTVSTGAADGGGYAILLDGRAARTPGRRLLMVPSARLAEAIAGEWEAIATSIDPQLMPLTRLANTAIDGVSQQMMAVADDVAKYSGSDLICYRADFPSGLVERQQALWDPALAWAAERFGVPFKTTAGLMPVEQPTGATKAVAEAVGGLDPFRLTALHVMTSLTGSALLGLAVLDGRMTAEAAWEAAHVDEDWQIAEWGADEEAAGRRAHRWLDMRAAATLALLAG